MTITQLFPIAGVAGDVVRVVGAGFAPGATAVVFGGVASPAVTVLSGTELQAEAPAGAAVGPVDVAVTVAGDTVTASLAFYVLAAPAASSAAALLQGGARAVFIDGCPVGFTDAPVRLSHEVDMSEAEVEQELGAVRLFPRRERWRMTLSLAEVSLEHLRLVFGGAAVEDDGDVRSLALGGAAGEEHSLLVQGPGPGGGLRDFYCYRAVVEAHDPLVIGREAPQRLPVTFRLLPNLTLPAGRRVLRIAEG